MDARADVLGDLRLERGFYARSDLGAPWGLAFSATDGASFHVVVEGRCWLRLADDRVLLGAGDLALLPHGRDHHLGDAPDGPTTPLAALPSDRIGSTVASLRYGGDGERALLICGGIHFAGPVARPLLELLPATLVVRRGDGEGWLAATLALLSAEARTPRPGGPAVLTRLMDILVIQAIRAWLAGDTDRGAGWLGALRDPQVGPTLALMHRRPAEPWTVASLAATAHLSRSVFSERFTQLVGVPPMRYLARWRMHLAGSLIREDQLGVGEVARRLGYGSEAAFSRAFKRHSSVAPGSLRRGRNTMAR